jgi:hypothetical protein
MAMVIRMVMVNPYLA